MKQKRSAKKDSNWAQVSMSPEAQAFYEGSFLPAYKELMKKIDRTPLSILIWGPGPGGGQLYEKRVQIRGQLRLLGLAAVFSEEIDATNPSKRFSSKAKELCQAIAADFIVVIQASPGSIAEVHDFAGLFAAVGRKMLIFIDERFQEGYSYSGTLQELRQLYNNVETYRYPEDISECHLLNAVEKKVRVLQAAKWRSGIE